MFDRDVVDRLDAIYEQAVKCLSNTDKPFDTDLTKSQFMWSAYEEYLNKTIDTQTNVTKLKEESLDKIRFSNYLSENGYFDKYSSNQSIHNQVKDIFKSLKDNEIKNIAEETDVVETLKRFVASELEPDLKTRAIKIILAQKQMLNIGYAHFTEKLE